MRRFAVTPRFGGPVQLRLISIHNATRLRDRVDADAQTLHGSPYR
jgi:hypothetical protein